MPRVKTKSIRVDDDLWDQVRKRAIDLHVDISTYIVNLALKDLKEVGA
jgi:Arc/MetJ family transcription regulator